MSIWDRIGEGVGKLTSALSGVPDSSSLFTPEELAAAKRRSLMTMGASMLAAQGQPLLQAAGSAIPVGQGAGPGGLARPEERRRPVLDARDVPLLAPIVPVVADDAAQRGEDAGQDQDDDVATIVRHARTS